MAIKQSDNGLSRSIGKFGLQKGRIKGITLFSLDTASPCSGDRCPISHMCPYEKKGFCSLEQRWIKSSFQPFLQLLDRVPSKFIAQVIGMHIMPLFRHLIILHKQQMALDDDEIINESDSKLGNVKRVHPVFDEIRRTSITILTIMAKSNIIKLIEQSGLMDVLASTPVRPDLDDENISEEDDEAFNMTYGDPGHLEAVVGEPGEENEETGE